MTNLDIAVLNGAILFPDFQWIFAGKVQGDFAVAVGQDLEVLWHG